MHKLRILPPAAIAAALTIFAAGCGSSSSASQGPSPSTTTKAQTDAQSVTGPLDEGSVKVNRHAVSAGKVTFNVVNHGKILHEFVVLRTDKKADALGKARRISEAGNVGEAGDIKPGATKKVTLDLKPGHYSLVCNIAGHYTSGMHTDFTVR